MVRKEADWEQFSASGNKLDGLTAAQEKNARVTLRKVPILFDQSYIFEMSNKSDEDNAMVHQNIKGIGAWMRDQFRRCTGKGVVEPINKQKRFRFEGCVDRWEKDEEYRKQMIVNGNTKVELQSWDAQKKVGLER